MKFVMFKDESVNQIYVTDEHKSKLYMYYNNTDTPIVLKKPLMFDKRYRKLDLIKKFTI